MPTEPSSYEIFQLKQWAEGHAARYVERADFYKTKSKAERRDEWAANCQGWADKYSEVAEALDLLGAILRFQVVPYSERIENPLYVGETSIKPSGHLWGIEANWENITPERLEESFQYIRDCKRRFIEHQQRM